MRRGEWGVRKSNRRAFHPTTFLTLHSSLFFRQLYPEPGSQYAAPNHAPIHVPNLSPPLPLAEHPFRDHGQRVTGLRDVNGGTVFVADQAARPNRLRIDHGEQVVYALDTVDGSCDLDGAIVGEITRHDTAQCGTSPVRLDGESLDPNAATLQRSRDADGERGFFRLPR